MRLPYFPGCALRTTASNFETATLAAAKALDVDLIELVRWNCCGTVHSLVNDNLMRQLAPIRNFIRVQEMNRQGLLHDEYRLLTFCSICYNTLTRANALVKNDGKVLETLNLIMDREEIYASDVHILHFFDLIREIGLEKIRTKVSQPLQGLKIAPYYGCLLLRPREVAIDNPEHPTIFEDLLEGLDVEVIDNPYKAQCCGSYHTVQNTDLVAQLAHQILSFVEVNGAEAVAVSCPLCAFNLDQRQELIRRRYRAFNPIPVFYFSQLMALAFGLTAEVCGFHQHYVDPRPLLEQKQLLKA
jgi:heterodisulfide reductase subunit B